VRKFFRREDGFSLLEALVALAIVALGLEFAVTAAGAGLAATQQERRGVEALARCRSHLAELGAPAALIPGEHTGEDGQGYRYRTRVTLLDVAPPRRALLLGGVTTALSTALYRIEVTVSWRNRAAERAVRLETYALANFDGATASNDRLSAAAAR